jgi:homoserine dehydrogenase
MIRKVVLSGYGNVGKRFAELLHSRKQDILNRYGIDLLLTGVIGSRGMIYEEKGLDLGILLNCKMGSDGLEEYGELRMGAFLNKLFFKGDLLVESTPTNIETGEPALSIMISAMEEGMDVVSISKGALVTNFARVMKCASDRGVRLKYSGATAAALPTIDIGEFSLAGSDIKSIRGILNGTTNFILTRMMEGSMSFEEALQEAKERGIAESNSHFDISGIDSSCKILLLSNSLMGTELSLKDIDIKGIENVTKEDIGKAKLNNRAIKLVASAEKNQEGVVVKVSPMEISESDLLYGVIGTNKGIVFDTDTMGQVAALGGASNPVGAAAAALKDVINLYR